MDGWMGAPNNFVVLWCFVTMEDRSCVWFVIVSVLSKVGVSVVVTVICKACDLSVDDWLHVHEHNRTIMSVSI